MCDDRIEIRVGEADVVDHLPARARERPIVARTAAAGLALTRIL